ncbi:MAG: hypothetical protein HYX69_07465 [Planctomycetia bacterium]|nr:hypothetical protein [Planctomycetia bacterium]
MGSHVPGRVHALALRRQLSQLTQHVLAIGLCAALVAAAPILLLADDANSPAPRENAAAQPRSTAKLSVLNGGQPRGNGLAQEQVEQALADRPDPFAQLREGEDLALLPFGPQAAAHGRPIAADFNGDGRSVTALFVDGEWFIDLNDNGAWDAGDLYAVLGGKGDQPLAGDWDGDGKADIGVFGPDRSSAAADEAGLPDAQNDAPAREPDTGDASRPLRALKLTADGSFRADPVDHVFVFDGDGGTAVAGDFNGDGIDSLAIFRDGHWWVDVDGDGQASDADFDFQFGAAGDQPIVGDFDGDGVDQIGIFRNGTWLIDANNSHSRDRGDKQFKLGRAGDLPTVGDWDGDGVDQAGVYRPPAAPSLSPGAERGRQSAVGSEFVEPPRPRGVTK